MLLHLLPHRKALASPGVLHPSAPNLMGMVLQPFPGRILLTNKNGEEGCEKANEKWIFSHIQEKQELAREVLRCN